MRKKHIERFRYISKKMKLFKGNLKLKRKKVDFNLNEKTRRYMNEILALWRVLGLLLPPKPRSPTGPQSPNL